jgi:AcrR family transcriptional regulator
MQEKHYHHGDLKQELIKKGVQLLAKEGYEGFSMRKLSSLCGVSHAAPYKHFNSKEEIISAISRQISMEFSDALVESIERYPTDARMRLIELGKQFIRFMVENPDYFRFVFMTWHGRPIEITSKGLLVGDRQPLAIAYKCAEEYFRLLHGDAWRRDFMAIWSMMQGYTLMLVNGTIHNEGDYLELAEQMIEGYIDGMGRLEQAGE